MHIARYPAKAAEAKAQGIPFSRAWCGAIVPHAQLTAEPNRSACPQCAAATGIQPAASQGMDPFAGDPELAFANPQVAAGAFDVEVKLEPLPDATGGLGGPLIAPPFDVEEVSGVVDRVFAPFDLHVEGWEQWSAPLSPPGSDPMQGDVRLFLPSDHVAFLQRMIEVAPMIGLTGVSRRIISLIHMFLLQHGKLVGQLRQMDTALEAALQATGGADSRERNAEEETTESVVDADSVAPPSDGKSDVSDVDDDGDSGSSDVRGPASALDAAVSIDEGGNDDTVVPLSNAGAVDNEDRIADPA